MNKELISIPNQGQNSSLSILAEGKEVIRITADGAVFWNGREIVGDEDFKAAMLDLRARLEGIVK